MAYVIPFPKRITAIALIVITCLALSVIHVFASRSHNADKLKEDLVFYINKNHIHPAPDDFVIELYSLDITTQKIVKALFLSLADSALNKLLPFGYKGIAINEIPDPKRINIYYIDPKSDPRGIIKKYNVYNAKSFVKHGIVLVNLEYIEKIISSSATWALPNSDMAVINYDPKTGKLIDFDTSGEGFDPTGRIIDLKAQRQNNPTGYFIAPDSIQVRSNIMICIYIIYHEIGHIFEYKTRRNGEVADYKTIEEAADHFFADIFVEMPRDLVFEHFKEIMLGEMERGFITFLSNTLRKNYRTTWNDLVSRKEEDGQLALKNSVFSRHPPLVYRLVSIMHKLFQAENRQITDKDRRYASEDVYRTVLRDKIKLMNGIIP